MLFTDLQFSIMMIFLLFAVFLILGYNSPKRSGGFFMMLAGFLFLGFDASASSLFSIYASVLLSPFGIFIILLGIRKAFFPAEGERTRSEGE